MPLCSAIRHPLSTVLVGLLTLASNTRAEADDPWSVLESLREGLTAAPQSADFVQIFRPSGFSSTEREDGQMHISLPTCLRWDYETPYAKSFLLCDNVIHTWNAGESTGRRLHLDSGPEPGLDLLRLRIEELRARYTAAMDSLDDGSIEVNLTPTAESVVVAEARITVDPIANHLVALAYEDLEGNTTRFEISGYRPLESPDKLVPPADLEWIDE